MKHELEQTDKAFFGHPKPLKTLFLQNFGKDFLITEFAPYLFFIWLLW